MPAHVRLFDGCAAAYALDLVGERWALLVVRDLLLGPKRFTDLRRGLPRISRNVLSQRLTELQGHGIVSKRTLPPPSGATVYELTEFGLGLEPVIQAIGHWAVRSPLMPRTDEMSADTFVLGLRSRFDPAAARRVIARYELRVGADVFALIVRDGTLEVRRGACDKPDLTLDADTGAMAASTRGDLSLMDVLAVAGGERAGLGEFAALFRAVDKPQPLVPAA